MLSWLRLLPAVVRLVPREVWYVLALALLYRGALTWHANKVDAYGAERFMAGYKKAVDDGKQLQAQAELIGTAISNKLKGENDETLRAIDRLGDDLRLRGPGKAACSYPAQPGAAASGHKPSGGSADAPVDRVPDSEGQQLIGLPFFSTVEFAKLCDANRNEALTWRKNDQEQGAALDKLKAQATP